MKKWIAKLFSTRRAKEKLELDDLRSVLLKPIGDAIGDAVVHIAHLEQLKLRYPNIRTGVLVSERNKALFSLSSAVDEVIDDKNSSYCKNRKKWQLYLDFQPTFTSKSIILDALLKPEIVMNFGKDRKKFYTVDTVKNYDFTAEIPVNTHIADYLNFSALAEHLGKTQVQYNLSFSDHLNTEVMRYWQEPQKVKILLNPQGSMREIPPAELSALLEQIDESNREKTTFLLTNTKSSADYLAQLETHFDIQLAPATDIATYCALVNSADIVIAVDGGGVHIACACGKTLLSFYAHHLANISRWYPKPKQGVESYMVIADRPTHDNNDTKGFSMAGAAKWLNTQIAKK